VAQRDPARALLIDLDGVLRRFDPAPMIEVELRYGLKPAAFLETAMEWDVYRPAMAGELTHEEWMRVVASRLPLSPADAASAVAEWQAYRGEVDADALAFVREVRAAGRKVGLATNATDLLPADLEQLGLTGEIDVVINSWDLKIHKPAPEFFDRAVRGARAAGMSAYRWTGPQHVTYLRKALELP
jgi:putative hydrolase of the HAD superfamily